MSRQPSGMVFLELDVDHLTAELDLERHARENGNANTPAPEQTYPDGTEARIKKEIIFRVEDAKLKSVREEKAINSALKSRQLAPEVARSEEVAENCEREFSSLDLRLRGERLTSEGQIAELEREIDAYRARWGVTRRPRITEEEDRHIALYSLIIAFSIVQLGANALLFAQGSVFGLAFGLALAVGVAFFDIGLHLTFGKLGARLLAPDSLNKWVGRVITGVSIVTVAVFNLGTVHLRKISVGTQDGEPAWDAWLPGLLESPFGFTDFLSWALFGVGVLCSGLAFASGWSWDDPIPLFRRNGRLVFRATEDLQDVQEERADLAAGLVKKYGRQLDTLNRRAENHVSIVSDSIARIRQLRSDYGSYCVTASETYTTLVSQYRGVNLHYRTQLAPTFFEHKPEVELERELPISMEGLEAHERREGHLYEELQRSLRTSRDRLRRLGDGLMFDQIGNVTAADEIPESEKG